MGVNAEEMLMSPLHLKDTRVQCHDGTRGGGVSGN